MNSDATDGAPAKRLTRASLALPSLLDRLADDRPDQKIGKPRALSRAGLAERVRAELTHLLNCASLESILDLEDYPAVATTGLNYGIRDLTGRTRTGVSLNFLERNVREAIVRFEPRLAESSLVVSCSMIVRRGMAPSLGLKIEGRLAGSPASELLRLNSVLQLEDGEARVEIDESAH